MRDRSSTHLVVIPSYNTGTALLRTVTDALQYWSPVWVVIDGSTDGSEQPIMSLAATNGDLRILFLPKNSGKGFAVLHALREASAAGFSHALTLDADGQHPAQQIPVFMATSQANPGALVLGTPVFDDSAPRLRVRGRRVSNWWANLETLWCGINDSLLGFRVYPIGELRWVMEKTRRMRRFDFDPEAAVRLCWRGLKPINLPAHVRYFRPEEGGISHFRYYRDNVLLTWMHIRLMTGFLCRLPFLVVRRFKPSHR